MNLTAQDLPMVKSVLVSMGVVQATASDGDVAAAHQAMLSGPNVTQYKAALEAGGVRVSSGMNWLTILGLLGGGVAVYLIWRNSQKTKQVSSMEYPEPEEDAGARVRKMGRALSAFAGSKHSMGRMARCGSRRRMGQPPGVKYEFESESRLEGYRRRRARK